MIGRTIVRNSVLAIFDKSIDLAVTLITAGWAARVLGPDTMGHYGFAVWLAITMSLFSSHAVGSLLSRYLAENVGRGDKPMAKAIARLGFWVQFCFALSMVAIGLVYTWTRIPEDQQTFNYLIMLSIFPGLMVVVPTAINTASEDFASNVIPGSLSTLIQPVGLYLALHLKWGLTGLAAGQLAGRTVDWVVRQWLSRKHFSRDLPTVEVPEELKRRMWRYYWQSSALLALDLIVWEKIEVAFLKKLSTADHISFYVSSFSLSTILLSLPMAFANACGATLMVQRGRAPETLNSMVSTWLRFTALLTFPMTLGMAALSSPVIRVIFAARYIPAIPVMALMAILTIPKAVVTPAIQLLLAFEKQASIVRWTAVSAAITLACDYFFISRYASLGAVVGNGIGQIVAAAGIWMLAVHTQKIQLPWRALTRTAIAASVMAAIVYAVSKRIDSPLIDTCVCVPVGVVLYVVMLKITHCIEEQDLTRLHNLDAHLPELFRSWYTRGLHWILAPVQY